MILELQIQSRGNVTGAGDEMSQMVMQMVMLANHALDPYDSHQS